MVALLGSTPRPVLPSVTWAAFRLLAHQPRPREELEELLLPTSLRSDSARPESAVVASDALVDLGLVSERHGELRVDPKLVDVDLESEEWYRKELRTRVLSPTRNKNLLSSDDGTRELIKAIAWFLAQPVENPPVSYNPRSKADTNSVTQLLNEQFGSDEGARSILSNSSRWPPFVRWGKYLGFVSLVPIKDGGPCPDPTEAIRDTLPDLAETGGEVELPRLLAALAKALPVLDGGSYRKLVEQQMDQKPTSAGGGETLSASLSFALLKLQDEGVLQLNRASDSPAMRTLSIRPGHRLPYSHSGSLQPTGSRR